MSGEDKFGERHWIPAQAGIHGDAGSEFAQTGVRPKAGV